MKNYLSLFLFLLPVFGFAQQINEKTASIVAKNFLSEKRNTLKKSAPEIVFDKTSGKIANKNYYIFNTQNTSGFVIVSANKKTYPVLAYSLENSFPLEDLPPEVEEWLNVYDIQIKNLSKLKISVPVKISSAWEKYTSESFNPAGSSLKETILNDVPPLISTTWNQGVYYNALCPETSTGGSGGHVWAGCVATAMAQLMKYWNYPDYGQGNHSYTHPDYGEQSADFQNTLYNWSNMPSALSSHNIDVATLIYHCGVSVNMDYSPSGSGAYSSTARTALINNFKYSTNTILTSKYAYTDENWIKMLRAEIDAGRPLYYAGYGTGGHAFNCDGYQGTDYFHFNWGWGGAYNGYFKVDDLTPGGSNFTSSQSAMVGLQPDTIITKFDSISAISLSCSVPYSGTTADGINKANIYPLTSIHETGKEKIHKITTLFTGRITAKLSGMTNNLDVFILKYADRNTALAWGDSIAYLDDAEPGTYYIVVDGRYAEEGNYTLEVICPDNKADLIAENAKVEPMYVQSGQKFFFSYQIKNIGNTDAGSSIAKYYLSADKSLSSDDVFIDSAKIAAISQNTEINIEDDLILPATDTSGLMYIVVQVDANNDIDETDDKLNFAAAYFQIPEKGNLDCADAIVLHDNEIYNGNTALEGDSLIDNYSCYWGLTNKEIVHSFTAEYTGMVNMEFSESLEGISNVLLLSGCNENTCINTFSIWEPADTIINQSFHVKAGVTYYLVVDGNNNYGNSEGAYSIKLNFPDKCPKPIIVAGSPVDKCVGDNGAYLYTDWGYPNYQWLKDGAEIPDAIGSGYTAEETGLYYVKVIENGCTGTSEPVQVRFSPKPSGAVISALSDTSFCEGGSVILQLSTGTGYTYQWTNNDVPVNGAEYLDYEAFESGVYRAEVTNISCTVKSNPITVTAFHSAKQNGDYLDMSMDSLISWWTFDNWGMDESGNNNYANIYSAHQTGDRYNNYSAFSFDGERAYIATTTAFNHPDTFTVSLWFKTGKSGKLIGFDDQRFTDTGSNYDRHIYIGNDGRVYFGVDDGTKNVISSSLTYNDDKWHMATASLSSSGMKLYVDAQLQAQNSTVTSGAVYSGYWKIAYGNLGDWLNKPNNMYYEGKLDDIAIYNRELSHDEIEVLYSEQKINIYAEKDVFCSTASSTNIVIENSEPDVLYQLINASDNLPVGSAVAGTSGTINLNTGTMTATTSFKIFTSNTKTLCSDSLDMLFTIYVNENVKPIVQIVGYTGNDACVGDTLVFTADAQFEGSNPTYQWQVNGQITGADSSVFISNSLSDGDVLKLLLTSSLDCATPKNVSDEISLSINNLPDNSLSLNGTTEICEGDSTIISANANAADYEWYLIEEAYRLDTTQSFSVSKSGSYFVRLTNEYGCVNYSDTLEFTLYPLPDIDLGADTAIANDQSIVIGTEDNFMSYLWNTGATKAKITVEGTIGEGSYEYWLKVNDGYCENSDTIVITVEQTTGLENLFSSAEIKLYPNPAKEFINIEMNTVLREDLIVEMRNSAGMLIWQKVYKQNTSFIKDKIRLKNYPKGLYFLNFINKNSQLSRKIIVE
jgi:hypothetical protein